MEDLKKKLEQTRKRISKDELYIELVDKTGERKFIKTKLNLQAN